MKKLVAGLFATVVAVVLIVCFASPFLASHALVKAAREGDAAGLDARVDFPAFRASLKQELNARAGMEIRERAGRDNGLAALGMLLAPSLVSSAVDTFVTPETIAAMVRSAEAPTPEKPAPAADAPAAPKDKVHQSWTYRDLNTFTVTLTRDDQPDEALVLLMRRYGLFDWKLAGVDLTPDPMA